MVLGDSSVGKEVGQQTAKCYTSQLYFNRLFGLLG